MKRNKHSTPVPNRQKMKKRIIGAVIWVLIFGVGYMMFTSFGMLQGGLWGFWDTRPLKADQNGYSNILIFGTTEDSEEHAKIGANQARTDSIMLASVDQQEKNMVLTSVPRDFWIQYNRTCFNGTEGKINAAYLCGSENGKKEQDGVKMLIEAVNNIYGLEIHYYVHVNFAAVQGAVDSVGGIEVEIESSDPRGIYDPAIGVRHPNGIVSLDGESAIRLARARDSTGEGYGLSGGNFAREIYQQKIILALRDKAAQKGILANPITAIRLATSLGNNIRTNFSSREMRTLAELAQEINEERIEYITLHNGENPLVVTGRVAGQSIVRPARGLYDYGEIHEFIQSYFP